MYLALFLSSFFAATLLPAQSEAVLSFQLASNKEDLIYLLLIATSGNVLGALVNWYLGKFFLHYKEKKWFPIKTDKLAKGEKYYKKYGRVSLLLSWMPIIGDPITFVAGVLKEPLWSFLILVTIAKGLRYIFIVAVTLNIIL